MAAETGHHANRVYIDQAGDLHLNGAKVWDASENDITSTIGGVDVGAAGTTEASKVLRVDSSKALDVLTVATLSTTKENSGVGASTAAAGSDETDAGALPAGTAKVYPTTGADDTKGVIIHSSDKVTGRLLFIGNGVSNKILKVYPPSGGTINGAAANAAFSSASGKGVVIVCLSSAGNTWLAW